ncbi:MAG: hypothetical protein KDC87_08540 [Planctomycetes bacterium]|nr:hypothetical protein [Planctomycetota bacterium]MCB9868953.1 hypothetical protein [Planctomycetota bacterium]
MTLTPSHAFLGLLVVAAGVPAPGQKKSVVDLNGRIDKALERARPVLLRHLAGAHNGELALLCLAAVHDGVPATDKVFAQALRRLRKARLGRTYDLSLRLMVASECEAFAQRKELARDDARRLLSCLVAGGGFGYHKGDRRWDLSNSQYAALGMRAAVALGVKIDAKYWKALVAAAIASQTEAGGFAYTAHRRDATESMTAAGIAILRLCADHLDDKTLARTEVDRRLRDGWEWLIQKKGSIGSRGIRNSFYFHYGLERACILSGVTAVDGKDWFTSGAEMLLDTQLRNGGWCSGVDMMEGGKDPGGADSVSTAFAVLFLRRKFQKKLQVGPITTGGGVPIHLLTDKASPEQVDTAIGSAVERGVSALPEVLRALRSTHKVQRVAGCKALIRITGDDFGFNPHIPPERSAGAVSKAELWYLKKRSARRD